MKRKFLIPVFAGLLLLSGSCESDGPKPSNQPIEDYTSLNDHLPLSYDSEAVEKFMSKGVLIDGIAYWRITISSVFNPKDSHIFRREDDLFILPQRGGEYQIDIHTEDAKVYGISFSEGFDLRAELEKRGDDMNKTSVLSFVRDKKYDEGNVYHDFSTDAPDAERFGTFTTIVSGERTIEFSKFDVEKMGFPESYTFPINRHNFYFPENKTGKDRLIFIHYTVPGNIGFHPEGVPWAEYMERKEVELSLLQKGE